MKIVARKAAKIYIPSRRKSLVAQDGIVCRFVKANRYAVCAVTWQSNIPVAKLEEKVKAICQKNQNKLSGWFF